MGLPELAARCGKLRKLRGEICPGMKLRVWKMTPDQAQGVVALEERPDRQACREAERAPEVPVLDQRQPGVPGAEHVVALSDRNRGAGGADLAHDIACLAE